MIHRDIVVSVGYIAATCLLSQIVRTSLKHRFPAKDFFGLLLAEFVAMFELCATCYEGGVVLQYHGILPFFYILFALCLWRSYKWQNVNACPYSYFEEWLNGNLGASSVLIISLAQIVGGSFVYSYYTKYLWSFEVLDAHKGLFTLECTSHVQVSPLYAAFIEAFGVFVILLTAKTFSAATNSRLLCNVVISFVVSCFVVAALGISGGYFNPALASLLQYGCSGSTFMQQFIVYWLSNIIGTVAAHYAWNYVQKHPTLKTVVGSDDSQKLKRG